jgi:hypothetical protein
MKSIPPSDKSLQNPKEWSRSERIRAIAPQGARVVRRTSRASPTLDDSSTAKI